MPLQENTVEGWSGVITELTTKRQSLLQNLELLRREKHELALTASLGDEDARKQSQRLSADIARASLQYDELNQALLSANEEKQKAEAKAAAKKERQRQHDLTQAIRDYAEHVKEIDAAMSHLAENFRAAKHALDRAEALMTAGERVPTQQLRSLFGATVAASHAGLGDHIELGRSAGYIHLRSTLATYTHGFVDRWTDLLQPNTNTNGKETN
jgi:hypothetical protein